MKLRRRNDLIWLLKDFGIYLPWAAVAIVVGIVYLRGGNLGTIGDWISRKVTPCTHWRAAKGAAMFAMFEIQVQQLQDSLYLQTNGAVRQLQLDFAALGFDSTDYFRYTNAMKRYEIMYDSLWLEYEIDSQFGEAALAAKARSAGMDPTPFFGPELDSIGLIDQALISWQGYKDADQFTPVVDTLAALDGQNPHNNYNPDSLKSAIERADSMFHACGCTPIGD